MGLRSWFSSLRNAPPENKSYQLVVQVGEDGFIPAAQFEGSDLYQLYTQAVWTYICASRISQDLAVLPPIVQRWNGDEWQKDNSNDSLNMLLVRPYGPGDNKPRWNWSQQVAAGALRKELCGNQFLKMSVLGNELTALGLILNSVRGVEDPQTGVPTRYRVGTGGAEFSAAEVVNIMHAAPDSWWRGVAPVVAAQQAIHVDYTASRRVRYDLEHRVAPGVVFKVRALFAMDETRKTEAKEWLTAQFEGAANAGKAMVVGDDVTVDAPPVRQVDDLPAHHRHARDTIISAHDISPPVVGVLDNVKYNNWEQSLRAQWMLCIEPRARDYYQTINTQAIWPVYGTEWRLWYDETQSTLALAAVRERAESAKLYFDLGYPTNAINTHFRLGMPMFDELARPNQATVIAGRETDTQDSNDGSGNDMDPETA